MIIIDMSKIASKALTMSAMVQARRLESVTNNIANVLTPGYKASKPVFQNILTESMNDLNGTHSRPLVSMQVSFIDFSGAPLVETGAKLDCAIEGSGFFVVSSKNGLLYTRNGQFAINEQKRLVTQNGHVVMGRGGEIIIAGKDIIIEEDGSIFSEGILVDTLKIVDFQDGTVLRNFGMSLFVKEKGDAEEIPMEKSSVKQGFIETSNVNLMEEMINLINCLRAYEACNKAKTYIGDADSRLMNITRLR